MNPGVFSFDVLRFYLFEGKWLVMLHSIYLYSFGRDCHVGRCEVKRGQLILNLDLCRVSGLSRRAARIQDWRSDLQA